MYLRYLLDKYIVIYPDISLGQGLVSYEILKFIKILYKLFEY